MRGWAAALAVMVLGLAGCATSGGQPDERFAPARPDVAQPGLRMSGTVGGTQVATSDGAPRLVVGNCDPARGPSEHVCFFTRDLASGSRIVVAFLNPDVLETGADLEVGTDCRTFEACAAVDDAAVVEVRMADAPDRRAIDGRLEVDLVEGEERYAGSFRLRFSDGSLTGTFDVIPRPD